MKHRIRKRKTNAKAILFSLIFTSATFFVFAFLISFIISLTKNPIAFIGISSFAALFLTGALSGFCTSKYKGEGGVLPAGLGSLTFALILLGLGLILSGGCLPALSLINLPCFVVLAIIFAALAGKKRKRGHR